MQNSILGKTCAVHTLRPFYGFDCYRLQTRSSVMSFEFSRRRKFKLQSSWLWQLVGGWERFGGIYFLYVYFRQIPWSWRQYGLSKGWNPPPRLHLSLYPAHNMITCRPSQRSRITAITMADIRWQRFSRIEFWSDDHLAFTSGKCN